MQVVCGNQDVMVDSRIIIIVGVISTGGLVEPPRIIFKRRHARHARVIFL